MGRLQNLRQGVLQRLPINKQNQQNNNQYPAKKDESLKLGLVDNKQPQPEEQKTRLRRLANLGRNVILRRRNSQQDVAPKPNINKTGDNNPAEDDTPDPQETLLALHQACSKKSDLSVIQYLVARHPQGAAAMKDGNLPLHTAVTFRAPAKVIEYLLEAYPQATGVRNKRYKLPIHIACECKASLEVIKLLVKADPESLEVADYDISTVQFQKVWIVHAGKFSMEARTGLPLHYACKYLASLHVIHHLITEYPDAARTKNKDGWLPVHFSCARGAPLKTIQYLMTACPSSLYERTLQYYEYPMHLAAGRLNANINVVKYLQSRHSIAVTQTKPNESLYLTYYDEACLQSAPPTVTWFLQDVCAKAAKGYAYVSTDEDPYN